MTVCATASGKSRSSAKAWLRALELTAAQSRQPERILPVVIEEMAEACGGAPALVSDRQSMSYGELAARSNQYSRWAIELGLGAGDTVGLLMLNGPEYMAVWLGITRTGCAVALLNTNLTGSSLAHTIHVVTPKHIIVGSELFPRLNTALAELSAPARVWVHGAGAEASTRVDVAIERYPAEKLGGTERRRVTVNDRALYIYTSGTTGLPKAANVSHGRIMQWSYWFAGMMDAGPDDRLYNCLPMYHSTGGVVATGSLLVAGGSVVLREKFAASQFWTDAVRWDCTLFQYIGELCRYLLNAPVHPAETAHRIRMGCGNGLSPAIWNQFQSRFQIPQIFEFYASTEGNISLFNIDGKPGSIGRIPSYLSHRFPAVLVRLDFDSGEPIRNHQGLCVPAGPDEVGEAIGRVDEDPSNPGRRFEGYTDLRANESKILRDVFESGDAWYRTGDLMRKDTEGYFYFVDRIGDTFRWKGENVATSEVAEVIRSFPGIHEASVYGVEVPGADGRAGMAAIVAEDVDLAAFHKHLRLRLPAYAQPLFLRFCRDLDATGTFKVSKSALIREGYDPGRGAVYFNSRESGEFVRLDAHLLERIHAGEVRI